MMTFVDNNTRKTFECIVVNPLKAKRCFWCCLRFPEGIFPMGCPINWNPNKDSRSFKMKNSPENMFTIREHVRNKLEGTLETIHSFCSFNCILAFIKDKRNNPKFRMSKQLLMMVAGDMTIEPSPPKDILDEFGGPLNSTEYRDSLKMFVFDPQERLQIVSSCCLFKKQLNLTI